MSNPDPTSDPLSQAIFSAIDDHFGPDKPDDWVAKAIVCLMVCLSAHLQGISQPAQGDARQAVAAFFKIDDAGRVLH